jgi:hypothetical protein
MFTPPDHALSLPSRDSKRCEGTIVCGRRPMAPSRFTRGVPNKGAGLRRRARNPTRSASPDLAKYSRRVGINHSARPRDGRCRLLGESSVKAVDVAGAFSGLRIAGFRPAPRCPPSTCLAAWAGKCPPRGERRPVSTAGFQPAPGCPPEAGRAKAVAVRSAGKMPAVLPSRPLFALRTAGDRGGGTTHKPLHGPLPR